MRLNLGCRDDIQAEPGWVNIDLYYEDPRILRGDVVNLDPRLKNAEEIRAHSVLEHLTFEEGEKALTEWCQRLASGGTISIQTPDFDTLYDTGTRLGVRHIAAQLYGNWREIGQAHKSCWQKKNIIEILKENDVEIIADKRWLDDMWLIGRKLDAKEE